MKAHVECLRRRRELLIVRAATQRSEVSSITLHLQQRLRPLDMGFAIVRAMRKHPVVAVASATLLLRAPRNKLLLWSGRLFTAWEFFYLLRDYKRAAR
jgi:hypothetical protein